MENAHPIEVVTLNDDHSFSLNESNLRRVLLQDDIKDRSVVVISVAGGFRKGKSFLLNFFLRYLYAQYRKHDISNWLGKDDEPLKGFEWGGGSKNVTTGILMWSDIFTIDYKNDDKIAIILLDTQGTFDVGSTVTDCSLIFALSTFLSSVQCYNLMSTIQEDDLMNLNLFTKFGRLACKDTGSKPFQHLHFIVRDWSSPHEHEYGANGGQTFLKDLLLLKPNLRPDSNMLREQIKCCFNEVECFLMPHPGLDATTDPTFDGSPKNIHDEFKMYLDELLPLLLSPENLLPKKMNGQPVKAHELVQMFSMYLSALQSDHDFNPKSIYMGLAEFQNTKAVDEAVLLYRQLIEVEVCREKSMNNKKLFMKHRASKDQAILKFQSMPKTGTADFNNDFMGQLDITLENLYASYMEANKLKQDAEKEQRIETLKRVLGVFGGIGTGIAVVAGTVASAMFEMAY